MKGMGDELNEAIRKSREIGQGSARSTRPNYLRIEALGVEPPTETTSEEANVEDVEVTIEPGFNVADPQGQQGLFQSPTPAEVGDGGDSNLGLNLSETSTL